MLSIILLLNDSIFIHYNLSLYKHFMMLLTWLTINIFGIFSLNFLLFTKATTTVELAIIPIEAMAIDTMVTTSKVLSLTIIEFAESVVFDLLLKSVNLRKSYCMMLFSWKLISELSRDINIFSMFYAAFTRVCLNFNYTLISIKVFQGIHSTYELFCRK